MCFSAFLLYDMWIMKWRSDWHVFLGPVILPCILKTIWCMNIIIWDYESVWPDVWPKNKCKSLYFMVVILCYILKTFLCMNITTWDYGSVLPDIWPQNKCMSLWPIFHGPVILHYISKPIWWTSVMCLISDNQTGWPKLWPQNKYRSTWPIFHGLVICWISSRLFDGWTS